MGHHLVHALAVFGVLVGQELRAHALIAGLPAAAAVVGAIDAAGRDRDRQALAIGGMGEDGVKAQPTAAWLPTRAMRVVVESAVERPGLPTVARFEERGRLDAA